MNAAGPRHTSEEAGVGSPRARRTEVPSILRAMQQPPQEARPRHRSAFASAFLSLIFPGLGHAYAGAFERALGFAALPFLALALTAGLALNMGAFVFAGVLIEYLPMVLVANIVLLVYRIVAAIDAYRVAAYLNAVELSGNRFGPPRLGLAPLSLAGLLAVCLVIAGGHGVVAYYGVQAKSTLDCIFDPSGTAEGCDQALGSPEPGSGDGSAAQSATPTAATQAAPAGSPVAAATIPPWNGTERLNILLIGADQRPADNTFNTDTLIVVSIDPVSKQVAMFSLPRDTVDVPLPPGPARTAFGAVYGNKINRLWTDARARSDVFPGNSNTRGFNALKSVLGYLYGLNIQYYAEVNFTGFRDIVDNMGGVTINVQNPVLDDRYPGDRGTLRVYIPAGVQHMTGSQALIYARSRHTSSDFDRAQRQQRIITSLREQVDPNRILANLPGVLDALKGTFKTDIPTSKLPQLIQLSSQIDTTKIRSFVFSPPRYQTEFLNSSRGYIIEPNVTAIRKAVATAFKIDAKLEAEREKLAGENGVVWVVNGSGQVGQASQIAAYLEYLGLTASAPTQRPDKTQTATRIRVYNGRESELPGTIALLENLFGVKAQLVTDPSVRVDIIVTTGTRTPSLTPPP